MPTNSDLEPQDFTLSREEEVDLDFDVLVAQYPNASVFDWKFQVKNDDGTVLLTLEDEATVASLAFTVPLSIADTTALTVGMHAHSLWDTTNNREIAWGTINVKPAQS